MKSDDFEKLGVLQSKVMDVLWELGEATVHQVRDELEKIHKDIAYTTVLSTFQKLEKAGWVKHKTQGRMYLYSAVKGKKQTLATSIKRLVGRVFRGDPMNLVHHILESEDLSTEDLAALRKILASKSGKKPNA
jgi:BlaI family transcriptional regulator, penicillinase repressor